MRGLSADERACLLDCLTPDQCDLELDEGGYEAEDRMHDRGLLCWVDCGDHLHGRLTPLGALALRIDEALRGAS